MLPVVGEERDFAAQGYGGNGHVCAGKGLAFLPSVAAQEPGLAGDTRGDGQILQAVQEGCRLVLFALAETCIHFGEIYRATSKNVSFVHEPLKVFGAANRPFR